MLRDGRLRTTIRWFAVPRWRCWKLCPPVSCGPLFHLCCRIRSQGCASGPCRCLREFRRRTNRLPIATGSNGQRRNSSQPIGSTLTAPKRERRLRISSRSGAGRPKPRPNTRPRGGSARSLRRRQSISPTYIAHSAVTVTESRRCAPPLPTRLAMRACTTPLG